MWISTDVLFERLLIKSTLSTFFSVPFLWAHEQFCSQSIIVAKSKKKRVWDHLKFELKFELSQIYNSRVCFMTTVEITKSEKVIGWTNEKGSLETRTEIGKERETNSIRGRFHQHFTKSFYVRRSQKRKKESSCQYFLYFRNLHAHAHARITLMKLL